MFNRRLKIEFDSLERRMTRLHRDWIVNDEHLVVKFRVYNRSLFRLKGDISVVSGVRSGCWGPEWSKPEEINIPGMIDRLIQRFSNSGKLPKIEADFLLLEVDKFSTGPFSFHVTKDFVCLGKEFYIPLASRSFYVESPIEKVSEDIELETGELVKYVLLPTSVQEAQKELEKVFKKIR